MGVKVKESGAGFGPIARNLKKLQGVDVLVGIPESDTPRRDGDPITNAQLLFIFSNGSPLRGIPARPVIEPAIEQQETADRIARNLANAAAAGMDGNYAVMAEFLKKAGTVGEGAARRWFHNPANGWPDNKPATIRRKLNKLSGRRKRKALEMLAAGALSEIDTPGIDSDQMRRAITSVIEGL